MTCAPLGDTRGAGRGRDRRDEGTIIPPGRSVGETDGQAGGSRSAHAPVDSGGAGAARREPPAGKADSAMRVLVIESDPSIGDLLADLLADEGHATGGAATVAEGLARARAEPWDACLTDGFWPAVVADSRAYLADLGVLLPGGAAVGARLGQGRAAGGPGGRRGGPQAVRPGRPARRARDGGSVRGGAVSLTSPGTRGRTPPTRGSGPPAGRIVCREPGRQRAHIASKAPARAESETTPGRAGPDRGARAGRRARAGSGRCPARRRRPPRHLGDRRLERRPGSAAVSRTSASTRRTRRSAFTALLRRVDQQANRWSSAPIRVVPVTTGLDRSRWAWSSPGRADGAEATSGRASERLAFTAGARRRLSAHVVHGFSCPAGPARAAMGRCSRPWIPPRAAASPCPRSRSQSGSARRSS